MNQEDIQIAQAAAPVAIELLKDLFGLFQKHAPNATVAEMADTAQAITKIQQGVTKNDSN